MIADLSENIYVQRTKSTFSEVLSSTLGTLGLVIIIFVVFLAVFAPYLAPYPPLESQYSEGGNLLQATAPSSEHLLGTTASGYDVLSQLIYGAQTSVFVGSIAAIMLAIIGGHIGILSGYYGGRVDNILMRLTDIVFGVPFLPFVIVLVGILGHSTFNVIIGIVALQWRSSARVIRAQTITVSEQQFIQELDSLGASDIRIIYKHIVPNVLPLILTYTALGLGWAIIVEASLSFLGMGAPLSVSWGQMMNNAFVSGLIRYAWWWAIPPGIMISTFVLGVFMFGRSLEVAINPDLKREGES